MVGPVLLMILAPVSAILVWHTHVALGGSLTALVNELGEHGIVSAIVAICRPVFFGSVPAWTAIAIFVGTELLLVRIVPGATFHGPTTPTGHVPVHRANGVAAFAVPIAL